MAKKQVLDFPGVFCGGFMSHRICIYSVPNDLRQD